MENKEIRRRNMWALAHPNGYAKANVRIFAEKVGISDQRVRHLIAKTPDGDTVKNIGDQAARDIEAAFNKYSGWMDEKHQDLWLGFTDNAHSERLSDAVTHHSLSTDDCITIQQYKDVRGAMGSGAYLLDTEGEVLDWRVTRQWANTKLPANTGIENLKIITGLGDSMKGLYNSGDPLIVDTGVTAVDYDAVYFFRVDDEGYVKRLQKTPKGILVKSKNPDYDTWMIEKDMDFEVYGRVLKVWEGKDL